MQIEKRNISIQRFREFKDANKSGTSTKAYERAERTFNQYQFLNWLGKFVQPHDGRNNLPAPTAEQSEHTEIREKNEAEEIFKRGNEDETVAADADDQSSQLSNKTLAKPFNPPPKKKSKIHGAAKEAVMEDMEFSLMKRMNEQLKKSNQQKSEKRTQPGGEELFAQALALDLKQLSQYEECITKGELRGIIMKHQMAVLEKQMRASYGSSPNNKRIASPASYSKHLQGMLSFSSPPQTPNSYSSVWQNNQWPN